MHRVLADFGRNAAFRRWPQQEALLKRYRHSNRWKIETIGRTRGGRRLYLARANCGGRFKVLLLGTVHPDEPVGSATCLELMEQIERGDSPLSAVDVEWNIVPCVDPDGLILNEAWITKPFDPDAVLGNYYRPFRSDDIECSFPLEHGGYRFHPERSETICLMRLFEELKPNLYYALHNTLTEPVHFFLSDDAGEVTYTNIREHCSHAGFSVTGNTDCEKHGSYAPGFCHPLSYHRSFLEISHSLSDRSLLRYLYGGSMSFDYLSKVNPTSVSLACEVPLARSPLLCSTKPTSFNYRRELIQANRMQCDLVQHLTEVWRIISSRASNESVFYKVLDKTVLLNEPLTRMDQDAIDPGQAFDRKATQGEFIQLHLDLLFALFTWSQILRLIRTENLYHPLRGIYLELKRRFDEIHAFIKGRVGTGALVHYRPRDLVRVQLAAGLEVINALM